MRHHALRGTLPLAASVCLPQPPTGGSLPRTPCVSRPRRLITMMIKCGGAGVAQNEAALHAGGAAAAAQGDPHEAVPRARQALSRRRQRLLHKRGPGTRQPPVGRQLAGRLACPGLLLLLARTAHGRGRTSTGGKAGLQGKRTGGTCARPGCPHTADAHAAREQSVSRSCCSGLGLWLSILNPGCRHRPAAWQWSLSCCACGRPAGAPRRRAWRSTRAWMRASSPTAASPA